ALGDVTGCKIVDGKLVTPPGFKEAWKSLYENGWKQIGAEPEWGGGGSPISLQVLVEEMITGSNTAFSMYAGLSVGAAEVVHAFATEEQRKLYYPKMLNGEWAGTMCLTEPQAGSDVGSARTTAQANGDGSYTIRGTKIFISAGEIG